MERWIKLYFSGPPNNDMQMWRKRTRHTCTSRTAKGANEPEERPDGRSKEGKECDDEDGSGGMARGDLRLLRRPRQDEMR